MFADWFIGMTGFEPATLASQTQCATKLRYIPFCLTLVYPILVYKETIFLYILSDFSLSLSDPDIRRNAELLGSFLAFKLKRVQGVSGFPSFRVSEFPSFRVSEFPSFRVSEFPSFRVRLVSQR
jgi:hypothetical protein